MIGMKVSKKNFDVLTTGNRNLIFSSELATHMIQSIISFTFTSGTDADIYHNLGYVPKVWVYQKQSGNFIASLPIIKGINSGDDYYITNTTIHLHRDSIYDLPTYYIVIFTRSPMP